MNYVDKTKNNSTYSYLYVYYVLHVYCQVQRKFPTYTINMPYTFIEFQEIFLPTQLLCPTLILETLEYIKYYNIFGRTSDI